MSQRRQPISRFIVRKDRSITMNNRLESQVHPVGRFTHDRSRRSPGPRARPCLAGLIILALLLTGCGASSAPPTSAAPTAPAADMTSTLPAVVIGTTDPTVTLAPTPLPTSTLAVTPTPTTASTATASVTPTATPRLDQLAPTLDSPANNSAASGRTTFRWLWNGPALAANQGFEVRIWKERQADHFGAAEPVRTTSAVIDLNQAAGVRQGGVGTYLWTVAVVQLNPYKRIGKEATPRALRIGGMPPTPSRSAAPVIGPGAAQRFAGAVGILSGSLLVGWLYLSGAFEAWLRRRRP